MQYLQLVPNPALCTHRLGLVLMVCLWWVYVALCTLNGAYQCSPQGVCVVLLACNNADR